MRRLWNERKLLLVLNFVVILPDKFNDTLAKFLKVEAEGTNLNGIGFAPHPALAVVASPDHTLALFGGASWHHREKFPLYFIFCISITTSMAPNTLRGVPKPSPVEAQSRFQAQQNHLKNALRFHQHNSMYLFFFSLPSLDFFPKFIFSVRLLTVGDCQPSATRARAGARGCSANRRMPGNGDQKHPTGWVYSHIYMKYCLAKICKTHKFGVRSCLCQN